MAMMFQLRKMQLNPFNQAVLTLRILNLSFGNRVSKILVTFIDKFTRLKLLPFLKGFLKY
jgi:hypothetical protein